MSIVASDLQLWLSVNNPEADATNSGGAIQDDAHASGGIRGEFVDISATGTVEVLSDGVDTRTVTVTGRLASGAIDSEAIVLNGTTFVAGTKSFERILKAVLSAKDAARTVTLRKASDDVTIATLGVNVIAVRRLDYDAASAAATKIRYELIYLKNKHGTLTLNSAAAKLTGDPQARVKIGVKDTKGDVTLISDRVQASPPTGIQGGSFVDDNVSVTLPTGILAAGERIGVWLEQNLPGSDPAFKNTWTVQLAGTST